MKDVAAGPRKYDVCSNLRPVENLLGFNEVKSLVIPPGTPKKREKQRLGSEIESPQNGPFNFYANKIAVVD